jgi:hypothetical protein
MACGTDANKKKKKKGRFNLIDSRRAEQKADTRRVIGVAKSAQTLDHVPNRKRLTSKLKIN